MKKNDDSWKHGTKIQMVNFAFLSVSLRPDHQTSPLLMLRRAETGRGGEAPHLCLWFSSTTLSLECKRRWKDEVGGGGMGAAAEAEERERTKRPHLNIHQLVWWFQSVRWMEHERRNVAFFLLLFSFCVVFGACCSSSSYSEQRKAHKSRTVQDRTGSSPASCEVFLHCSVLNVQSDRWH